MIIDNALTLAKAQAVTVAAETTNTIDQGKAGSTIDNELYVVVHCTESATAVGAATVQFTLQTATDEAFTASIVLAESAAIPKAALLANTIVWKAKVGLGAEQYIRGYHTIGTGPLTAGKFSWYFTPNVQVMK